MLRLAMLALGASLVIGTASADEANAQTARDRAEAARRGTKIEPQRRGDVVVRENDRWDCDDDDDRRGRDRAANRGRDRDRDRDDWCDDDRRDKKNKNKNANRTVNAKRGNGPAFCRSGEGHPVFGRDWCRQKGYDTGYGNYSRVDWEDVILRRPRNVAQQRDLGRGTLQDILGSVVLGRFDRQRNNLGYAQPLYGRWVDSDAGAVLRVLSGSQPIAQIIDRDRDGRADVILLYNGR